MRTDTLRATSNPNHTKSGLTPAYTARVLRRLLHLYGAKAHSREIFMKRKLALARSLIAMCFHILRARYATLLGSDRSPHFYSGRLGISFRGGSAMFCKILRDAVNFKI